MFRAKFTEDLNVNTYQILDIGDFCYEFPRLTCLESSSPSIIQIKRR